MNFLVDNVCRPSKNKIVDKIRRYLALPFCILTVIILLIGTAIEMIFVLLASVVAGDSGCWYDYKEKIHGVDKF